MSPAQLTSGEWAAWREFAATARRWIETPNAFHAQTLRDQAKALRKIVMPPPWERPAMLTILTLLNAARILDASALQDLVPALESRLPDETQPDLYYLRD